MRSNWANLTIILLLSVCIITGCQWNTPVTTEPTNVTHQTTEQTVVTEESTTATLVTEATLPPTAPTEVTDPTEPEGIQEDKILEKYLPDYQQNQDLVGWIRLPGTRIDNPVLQTGVDNPRSPRSPPAAAEYAHILWFSHSPAVPDGPPPVR